MSCTSPITAWRSDRPNKNGRFSLVFSSQVLVTRKLEQVFVPCGRCVNCLLERSRQWAMRCEMESKSHERNSFITLTYSDENLSYGFVRPTLVPRDLTLFFKRLRKKYGRGIKYFACGEYGETTQRPHYHACIFGLDWKESRKPYSERNGNKYFMDNELNSLWGMGNVIVGDFSFETAGYVARYVVDKKYGENAGYYKQHSLEPEFVRMSRRPGIGFDWLHKWREDVYPHDYVISRGMKVRPPKYFDGKLMVESPDMYELIKERRVIEAENGEYNRARLRARNKVKESQLKILRRDVV